MQQNEDEVRSQRMKREVLQSDEIVYVIEERSRTFSIVSIFVRFRRRTYKESANT